MVAIYSTLGLTPILAGVLVDRGLLDASFIFGLFLIMVAIVTQGLKTRPGWGEIGIWLGIVAVYLMMFLRMAIPQERTHLVEYSIVATLIYEAFNERTRNGHPVPASAFLTVGITALLGLLDEYIQAFLPNRAYDLRDVAFNALAGMMAVAANLALAWGRRR